MSIKSKDAIQATAQTISRVPPEISDQLTPQERPDSGKPMGKVRDRFLSTRLTEEEWKQLEPLWTGSGLSRGEWCRKVLLDSFQSSHGSPVANTVSELTTVLAEVLASRTIMINLLHALGRGDSLSAEQVRTLTERADAEKLRRALDRLQQFRK